MNKAYLLYLTLMSLLLSSCTAESLKFWENKTTIVPVPFQLTGFDEKQSETKEYVETTIKDKFVMEAMPDGEAPDADMTLYQARGLERDIIKAMNAKGYYNADIDVFINAEELTTFDVIAGQRALITAVSVIPESYKGELDGLGLKAGIPLEAKAVLTAQAKIYKSLQEQSCAYDLNVSHQVILNSSLTRAEVVFHVQQGKPASFGTLSYEGNETVEIPFLEKLAKWEEGGCFKKRELDALRSRLLSSELFSRADPVIAEGAEKLDTIPVTMELKERPHRSIKAGISYYTDEELGVSFGWEHRNFLGQGEKVNTDLSFSSLEQALETTLTKPYFLREDQDLSVSMALKREDTDAYNSYALEPGFVIKRDISKHLAVNVGADLEFTHIKEDDGDSDNYALLSPMTMLNFDNRDDPLDPHKGVLAEVRAEPTIDLYGTSDPYIKTQVKAQSYYEAHERVVFAGRINVGTILGASTLNLPASERFYAGGGGSVRGFGYQEIGPFENGDPVGGRSLFEGSLELRIKATDKIGAVAFVDAGQVDDEVTPAFDDLAIGAGAGLRYYTNFGPLRFDVGVPLQGNENSDDNFQVYISIGQAF